MSLKMKHDEQALEELRKMSREDFLGVIEGMVAKIGKGVTSFMVAWNEPDADRKDIANRLNEAMYEPTEYLTLVTLLLKILQREPDMGYDEVMDQAFSMRRDLNEAANVEDFINKMQEIKDGKH